MRFLFASPPGLKHLNPSFIVYRRVVLLSAWPLLQNSSATPAGLLILLISMLAYSAAVYCIFRGGNWGGMHMLTINGWQTLLGGIFLVPFLLFTYQPSQKCMGSPPGGIHSLAGVAGIHRGQLQAMAAAAAARQCGESLILAAFSVLYLDIS